MFKTQPPESLSDEEDCDPSPAVPVADPVVAALPLPVPVVTAPVVFPVLLPVPPVVFPVVLPVPPDVLPAVVADPVPDPEVPAVFPVVPEPAAVPPVTVPVVPELEPEVVPAVVPELVLPVPPVPELVPEVVPAVFPVVLEPEVVPAVFPVVLEPVVVPPAVDPDPLGLQLDFDAQTSPVLQDLPEIWLQHSRAVLMQPIPHCFCPVGQFLTSLQVFSLAQNFPFVQ